MKNLKKLAIISAMLGATCSLKAFEKSFKPVEKGEAEAQGIEMIAGQLMVKSNGQMNGVDMPYTFVGTNTTNFASSAFAVKEMADANSVLLDKDNNDVYFTRSGDTEHVYKFSVSNKPALNGLDGKLKTIDSDEPISGILSVKDGKIYVRKTDDTAIEIGTSTTPSTTVTVPDSLTNTVHYVYGNKIYVATEKFIYCYDNKGVEIKKQINGWEKHTPKDIVVVNDEHPDNIFVLATDQNLFHGAGKLFATSVKGIKATKDGRGLLITSNNGNVSLYNTEKGKSEALYSASNAPFTSKSVEKDVTKNGLRYFVNKKLIGYNN